MLAARKSRVRAGKRQKRFSVGTDSRILVDPLNNWRKHREDQQLREARTWLVDPFSTGALFAGWKEREDEPLLWKVRATYQPLIVYLPSTWLLQKGWLRGGGRFSVHHVPSQRPVTAARG
jgi:hypothetical protein